MGGPSTCRAVPGGPEFRRIVVLSRSGGCTPGAHDARRPAQGLAFRDGDHVGFGTRWGRGLCHRLVCHRQHRAAAAIDGYWDAYLRASEWFVAWGFLAVLGAGFSPVPYKVFTIAAGALQMVFPLFIAASFIGRGSRFFLVAGLLPLGRQAHGAKAAPACGHRRLDFDSLAGVVVLGSPLDSRCGSTPHMRCFRSGC